MALREVRAASLRRDMNEPVRYEALCADLAKEYAQQRSSGASTKSFEGWLRDRMSAREKKCALLSEWNRKKTSKWRLPAQVPAWSYQNSGREHEVAYFAKRRRLPRRKHRHNDLPVFKVPRSQRIKSIFRISRAGRRLKMDTLCRFGTAHQARIVAPCGAHDNHIR